MNTPLPNPTPTPQTTPTAAGIAQSLLTGYLAFKASTKLGLPPDYASVLAAGVASSVTSVFHQLAQRWHLSI